MQSAKNANRPRMHMTDVLGNWKASMGKGSPKYTIPNQTYHGRVTYRTNSKTTFQTVC